MQQQLILLQTITAAEAIVIQLNFLKFKKVIILFHFCFKTKQKNEDKNNRQNNIFNPESNDEHEKILTKNLEVNESMNKK